MKSHIYWCVIDYTMMVIGYQWLILKNKLPKVTILKVTSFLKIFSKESQLLKVTSLHKSHSSSSIPLGMYFFHKGTLLPWQWCRWTIPLWFLELWMLSPFYWQTQHSSKMFWVYCLRLIEEIPNTTDKYQFLVKNYP